MVFKKKYENYFMAKLWRHYTPISQKEVNDIIQNYGKKPMANYEGLLFPRF